MELAEWLHRRMVKLAGREVQFRDREAEAQRLLEECETPGVSIMYGPLGAGKSTILRLFAEWFGGQKEAAAVYLNYEDMTHSFINVKPAGLKRLRSLADGLKAAGDLLGSTAGVPAGTLANAAVAVALAVRELAMNIHQRIRRAKARRVVVIHDDLDKAVGVRGLGADAVYSLVTLYAGLFEGGVPREMPWGDKEVKALIAVSDWTAVRLAWKYRGKGGLHPLLLWNLPRGAFLDLARELGSPLDGEALWLLLGGNARALDDLAVKYRWNLERWISEAVTAPTFRHVDPKALASWSGRVDDLAQLRLDDPLLEENVLTYVGTTFRLSHIPQEPWIDRRLAFQLPIYYWTLKAMAERHTTDITPQDVLKAAGLAPQDAP